MVQKFQRRVTGTGKPAAPTSPPRGATQAATVPPPPPTSSPPTPSPRRCRSRARKSTSLLGGRRRGFLPFPRALGAGVCPLGTVGGGGAPGCRIRGPGDWIRVARRRIYLGQGSSLFLARLSSSRPLPHMLLVSGHRAVAACGGRRRLARREDHLPDAASPPSVGAHPPLFRHLHGRTCAPLPPSEAPGDTELRWA